jgi:hypothetical protein
LPLPFPFAFLGGNFCASGAGGIAPGLAAYQERLIGLLDVLESLERKQRKRLEEIPW